MPSLQTISSAPTSQGKKDLLHDVGRAIADFDLISDGDRIMVAISGGKDSYALLLLLETMRRRAPIRFELVAMHLDQGQPGHDVGPLAAWLGDRGFEHRIVREDTYSIVKQVVREGQTPCSMCARLRWAVLYRIADELRCNKIALGHHRDDAIETLLLNLFFGGKLASMPAHLTSDDGAHTVIRPLIYCAEKAVAEFSAAEKVPILPCNLCGSLPNAQRKQMKALLENMESQHPNLRQSMLAALGNVHRSHLLEKTPRAPLATVTSPDGRSPA